MFSSATMKLGALQHDKGADLFPSVRLFQAMQAGSAQRMCRSVDAAIDAALEQPSGGGAAGTIAQALASAARDIPSKGDGGATQDVPQALDGTPPLARNFRNLRQHFLFMR